MNKIYILLVSLILVFLFSLRDANKMLIYNFLISTINETKKLSIDSKDKNTVKDKDKFKYAAKDIAKYINKYIYKYRDILNNKKQLLVKKIFYKKINFLWKKDLHNLIKKNIPPKEWYKIKSIEWNNKEISKNLKSPVILKKNGSYHLNIYAYLLNEDYSALVIQYNLTNIKNKNLIWEFSRTFKTKSFTN